MTDVTLTITESNGGIGVELQLKHYKTTTPQEKLFATQMAKTITDFLNNAPRQEKPSNQGN
jgi:uncharacterized membrane protein YcaP (DUF421 family)